jgi:DNA-binding NarL/FixJ family response regulator
MPARLLSRLQSCGASGPPIAKPGSRPLELLRNDARDSEAFSPIRLSPALVVATDSTSRQRLAHITGSVVDIAEVTEASSFAEACAVLECVAFSLAVVDIAMPDGLELVARVRHQYYPARVLVVGCHDDLDTVLTALHAGATGYVLKEREDIELVLAIKSIQRGGTPIDPSVLSEVLSLLPKPVTVARGEGVRLSARELEVLQLLARGCSNRDIADLILLSPLTVSGHIKSLYRKLGVGSRTAAVFEAQRLGVLS